MIGGVIASVILPIVVVRSELCSEETEKGFTKIGNMLQTCYQQEKTERGIEPEMVDILPTRRTVCFPHQWTSNDVIDSLSL